MQKVIALEGIGGSGKTTQLQRLHDHFSPHSYVIPELNQHPLMKESIQKWRKKYERYGFHFDREDVTNLAIARAQSQADYLARAQGKDWIFMDRGVYGAMVYECGQLSMEEIEQVNKQQGVIFPRIAIILDCDITEALRRVDSRRLQQQLHTTRAVHETEERFIHLRRLYQELAKQKDKVIKIVDSGGNEDITFQRIMIILHGERL